MDIGCEFPPPPHRTTEAGWEAFRALHPKVAKFRLGSDPADVARAREIMGEGGTVLWRPRQETPTPDQLAQEWATAQGVNTGVDSLELENEPNHPQSKWVKDGWDWDDYRKNFSDLVWVAHSWGIKVVAPGLVAESSNNMSNTVRWLASTAEVRQLCDYKGGHVYHTQGLDGIMYLPRQGEVVTEFGYSGDDRFSKVLLNMQVMGKLFEIGIDKLVFFILPYEEGQAEWGRYFMTVSEANQYRLAHETWHAVHDQQPIPPVPQEDSMTQQQKNDLLALIRGAQAELGEQFISNDPFFAAQEIGNAIARAKDKLGAAYNYADGLPVHTDTIPGTPNL